MTDKEQRLRRKSLDGGAETGRKSRKRGRDTIHAGDGDDGQATYEVKYQCQSCHTIGGSGGYVGPYPKQCRQLAHTGVNQAWLRNPQALQADTIEPKRNFTDDEIRALTAYLMTLRAGISPQTSKSAANVRTVARESAMKSKISFVAMLLASVMCAAALNGCKKSAAAIKPDEAFGAYDAEADWNDSAKLTNLGYQDRRASGIFYQYCVWCHADASPPGPSNRSNLTPVPALMNDGEKLERRKR